MKSSSFGVLLSAEPKFGSSPFEVEIKGASCGIVFSNVEPKWSSSSSEKASSDDALSRRG